jgi:tRNA threonylcarbamoyladenosine biosynthesis protein TsaE
MNQVITLQTNNATETEQLGKDIGSRLRGGEVIELISDLGGGKTTFTRGLVRGTGSNNHVASPTFTISRKYMSPKFEIMHFDFYRLTEAGVLEHELHDFLGQHNNVLVIEWGEIIQHVLPKDRLTIEIIQLDTDSRELKFDYPPKLSYLMDTKQ